MPAKHKRNSGVDKEGELHLTALDTVVPEAAKQLQRRLERRIPLISLADLLNEVDRWTGFLRHFTDLVRDEVPEGKRRQMLTAVSSFRADARGERMRPTFHRSWICSWPV